jgi:spore germination protein GerM
VRRLISLLAVLAAALCGCGVSTQRAPEAIAVRTPKVEVSTAPSSGPVVDTVFFVHGTRLQAVQRRTTSVTDVREALNLLAAGPTAAEVRDGTRTALTPQTISVLGRSDSGVLTLGVTRQFTGVVGGDQLLAVAQVVWTVCQFPWVDGVRFVVGGDVLELPTDHGLVQRTVTRQDYRTVAPPSTSVPSTPAPPT